MDDEERKVRAQELIRAIQEKAVLLSDLEVILEDYQQERKELLREISRLKASLWELSGDAEMPPSLRPPNPRALDQLSE